MPKNERHSSSYRTRDQLRAEKAYGRVAVHQQSPGEREYRSFALSFPALIHSCGLVQALAFAQAKGHTSYLEDLEEVVFFELSPEGGLVGRSRQAEVTEYMLLSRHAEAAAGWLKRYAEALLKKE